MRKLFCKCAVLALTMAFAALCATAAEYDVTRYGARPDGKSDNTAAIQKAINDCAAGTFWLYAAICVIGFVVIARFLRETKGQSLN